MRINKIELSNFKCFQDLGIDLGKINILTGANSSGKSSLIYSLLAMLQTKDFPFELSPNGDFINMGNFRNMVSGYDIQQMIGFSFSLHTLNNGEVKFKTLWANNPLNGMPRCKRINYDSGADSFVIDINNNQYSFTNEQNETSVYESIAELKKGIAEWYGNVSFLHGDIEDLKDNHFNYINSYRINPERGYFRIPKAEFVKPNGRGFENVICEWSELKSKKMDELIHAMKELGLISDIKLKSKEQGDFEVQVQTKTNGVQSSLIDVGFGVSKILPVIVADLQLDNDSIFVVSEPEIDLHPTIQANFADYMTKQVKTNNKQYIIETHSEYLLNRIRLLIAKGELKESDVKVYFFDNDGQKTETYTLQFKKNGEIQGAPENFFNTYMIDTMQLALASFDND